MADGGRVELSDHHQSEVVAYLRFARYKRDQNVNEVVSTFDSMAASVEGDPTAIYNQAEVASLVSTLREVISSSLVTELVHATHTNALLLQQYFAQADKWSLRLRSAIAELENEEALQRVATFEETALGNVMGGGGNSLPSSPPQLPSLDASPALDAALLAAEVDRLKAEVADLRAGGSGAVGGDAVPAPSLASNVGPSSGAGGDAAADAEAELAAASAEIERLEAANAALARELDGKVTSTTQFQNVMKMLGKKNKVIKDLRRLLAEHAPDADLPADDDDGE